MSYVLLHTRILISHGPIATDETATETRQRGGGGERKKKKKKKKALLFVGADQEDCVVCPAHCAAEGYKMATGGRCLLPAVPWAVDYKHGR